MSFLSNLTSTELLFFKYVKELVSAAEASSENYDASKDKRLVDAEPEEKKEMREMIMFKGQSKRLWNELYKVIYF